MPEALDNAIRDCVTVLDDQPQYFPFCPERLRIYRVFGEEKWDTESLFGTEEPERDDERLLTEEYGSWFNKPEDAYITGPTPVGHQRRCALAFRAVAPLCRFWIRYCGSDKLAVIALNTARQILAGKVSLQLGLEVAAVLHDRAEGYTQYDTKFFEGKLKGTGAEVTHKAMQWFSSFATSAGMLIAANETDAELVRMSDDFEWVKENILSACAGVLATCYGDEEYAEDKLEHESLLAEGNETSLLACAAYDRLQNLLSETSDEDYSDAYWRWWLQDAVPRAYNAVSTGAENGRGKTQ